MRGELTGRTADTYFIIKKKGKKTFSPVWFIKGKNSYTLNKNKKKP